MGGFRGSGQSSQEDGGGAGRMEGRLQEKMGGKEEPTVLQMEPSGGGCIMGCRGSLRWGYKCGPLQHIDSVKSHTTGAPGRFGG